jgi:hypothetical protein
MSTALARDWVFWAFSLPFILLFILLTVTGSRILINPIKLDVSPCGDATMFRSFPLADTLGARYPVVRYVTTVTPMSPETNGGNVCREDNWRGQRYSDDFGRGFGTWAINRFAEPCMNDPLGFTVDIEYTALMFDAIPLRPINTHAAVITRGTDWESCPFTPEEAIQ